MFAPSNAAFTSALLSGQLWQSLAPSASEMRQLLLDHVVTGRRLTLADLQQLASGAASNGSSDGAGGGAASDGGGDGGAYLQMASGRRAPIVARNGAHNPQVNAALPGMPSLLSMPNPLPRAWAAPGATLPTHPAHPC